MLNVTAIVWLLHIDQETSHWNLIDSQLGVLSVHRQRDQSVGLGHLAATFTWNHEARSILCHPDWSLHILDMSQVLLELQAVEERAHSVGDTFRLIMKRVQHEQHLDEAHDAHTLRTPSRVQLLTEVKTTAVLMTDVRSKEIGIFVEFRSEIFQEVRFSCLEVVGLDGVKSLGEATERNHVINIARHNWRAVEVVQRRSDPRVRANDVLVALDEVFNWLNRHGLAVLDFDLEVGSLIHQLLVGTDRDLAAT